MSASRHDHHLPGDLYHAAIDPDRWPELLDRVARSVGARSGTILSMDLHRADSYSVARMSRLFDEGQRVLYEREYSRFERDHLAMVAASEPGSIVIDPAFESERDAVLARPDVAFLRQHYSIVDRFGMRLNEDGGRLDCLACQYAESRGNIGAAEVEALIPLVPHLSQTLLLARTFGALKAQYRAVLAVLDRVDVALCLVDVDARIVLNNRAAQRMLDRADVVYTDVRGQLRGRDADADAALRASVESMARTACHEGGDARSLLPLPTADGSAPCLAELSPVHDTDDELGGRFSGAIVTVIDPSRRESIETRGLDLVYGLTPAELAVADRLLDGSTYTEIAEIRSVSTETVKTQVRSLLTKTGTRNRSELVRRVLMLNVPMVL